jgi:hypothetical protein
MSHLLMLDALLTSALIGCVVVASGCAIWVLPWTDAELDADISVFRADWARLVRALPRHRAELSAALHAQPERQAA